MANINLAYDEAIIFQSGNVTRDGYDESEFEDELLREIILTNKNLIYVVSDLEDEENEDVIKVPLTAIKVIGGNVQAKEITHDYYGRCLQVQFQHGVEYWRFGRKAKTLIPQWLEALNAAIWGYPLRQNTFTPPNRTASEGNSRKKATAFDGISSFASAVKNVADDTAKFFTAAGTQGYTTKADSEPITPRHEESSKTTARIHSFCSSCGASLNIGAKFCHECGVRVGHTEQHQNQRQQEYVGKVYKCPNCGSIISNMAAICPDCGMKISNERDRETFREFQNKIYELESRKRIGVYAEIVDIYKDIFGAKNPMVALIKNYPIPDSIDYIVEFMIYAASHLENTTSTTVCDAWRSKMKQMYMKAKISFPNDPAFREVENMYYANK